MSDHEYRKTILDNGFEVHTAHMPRATSKVYGEIYVNSGSCHESGITGSAHYLEHMFGYGSDLYGKNDLLPYFENIGGHYNFMTGPFVTYYFGHAKKHKVDEYLERMASVLKNPAFNEEHVETERTPIYTEALKNYDDNKYNLGNRFFYTIYDGHRFSLPNIGKLEDIKKISIDDLREFYNGAYVASNMGLIVCGNVDHDEYVLKAKALFDDLPKSVPSVSMKPLIPYTGTHIIPVDVQSCDIVLGFSGTEISIEELTFRAILGRKLRDELRENLNIVYSAGAYSANFSRYNNMIIQTSADPVNTEKITGAIFKTLENVIDRLSKQDIEFIVNNFEEEILDDQNDSKTIGEFLRWKINTSLPYEDYADRVTAMRKLSPEKVRAVGERMVHKPYMFSVAGSIHAEPDVHPVIEAMRDKYINSRENGLKQEFGDKHALRL